MSGSADDFEVAMLKEGNLDDLENSRFQMVYFKQSKIYARNYNVKLVESINFIIILDIF